MRREAISETKVLRRPFAAFFEAAIGSPTGPYPYQACLARSRCLPDVLAVPTGCGKTAAATLAWAWRRLECPDPEIRNRTPRRLIYCLPMRSLVEQVHKEIIRWFANLGWVNGHSSTTGPYRPNWDADRVPVFRLMGGEEAVEWEGCPEKECILVGTQDMLLSRALNRGYAMWPSRWPMAFGLVNVDALWILDEVQLMGVGRTTSVQLHEFRHSPYHLPRASLWMSATIGVGVGTPDKGQRWAESAPDWMRTPEHGGQQVSVLGLGDADRKKLSRVLTGRKYLRKERSTVEDPSLPVQLMCHASDGQLVLVMVNRVARAQELYKKIRALVHMDINNRTYQQATGAGGREWPSWFNQEANDAQIQPVRHHVDAQRTPCPRSESPPVYVTVSGRGARQDRPAGCRGYPEQGDRRASRYAAPGGEQVAQAFLPRTPRGTRGPVAARSAAGFSPLGSSPK